jgi:glucose-6-phosphate 1-dehydrogenase
MARLIVVFGASGSLATTKLLPAIKKLTETGSIGRPVLTIGVDLKAPPLPSGGDGFAHVRGDLNRRGTYSNLATMIRSSIGARDWDSTFYLATQPQLFRKIIEGLEAEGLNHISGRRRILVEKPLGIDKDSSEELVRQLGRAFGRDRTFLVDHFLGKPGVTGIASARLGSPELEQALNRDCVDHIQIMADESSGVEGRGSFYDRVGVMRDMVQNHLLQVLCEVAAELPSSDSPVAQDHRKAGVLKNIAALGGEDLVWGQYIGYDKTEGVASGSRTPTYVALKLSLQNKRWEGVPFFVRTGKNMRDSLTRVAVVFRQPMSIEVLGKKGRLEVLAFEIDPRARIRGGRLGNGGWAKPLAIEWREILESTGPDEYKTLLRAALGDDHRLFAGDRFNRLAWSVVDPLTRALEEDPARLHAYRPGTSGPEEADQLTESVGRSWLR